MRRPVYPAGCPGEDALSQSLSGDLGVLSGGEREAPLCEMELEYKSGDPEAVANAANDLARRFSLSEEPRSKFVRAMALTKEEP